MFAKKLKLRNLIDKHQNFFQGDIVARKKTPPPPLISKKPSTQDVALDINAVAFENLLYGFVRSIINNIPYLSYDHVSDDVIRLCLAFYNTGFENIRFDLFNQKYCTIFYNEILKSAIITHPAAEYERDLSCHRIFTSSIGYNVGIHKWKIQCISMDDKHESLPYGAIGIVSDNTLLQKNTKYGDYDMKNYRCLKWLNHKSFGSVIYFCQGSKCIYHYQSGRGKILYSKKLMKDQEKSYGKGDIITIILDCNRWKLKILRNGKNILLNDKEIEIKKKYRKYYPVVAFYHHGDTYRVLRK